MDFTLLYLSVLVQFFLLKTSRHETSVSTFLQSDSERQEKETMAEQYEEEIEELNNRLMALSKYSDALNESKSNMSTGIPIS